MNAYAHKALTRLPDVWSAAKTHTAHTTSDNDDAQNTI